jgi:hypothetical protein
MAANSPKIAYGKTRTLYMLTYSIFQENMYGADHLHMHSPSLAIAKPKMEL